MQEDVRLDKVPHPALPLRGGGGNAETPGLSNTQKRLIYRSWHRGTREMDILVGRFADAVIPSLDADGLAEFEALLECEDPDLWDYVTGKQPVPDPARSGVMEKFLGFSDGKDAQTG